MSEQDKRAAKEHAERAGRQVKAASKNTTRAAKAAAKVAAEKAGDVVEEINDTAEDAVEEVADEVRPAIQTGTKFLLSPLGKATIGYGIAIGAAIYAIRQTTKIGDWSDNQ